VNTYTYEDIKIGQEESFCVQITDVDMEMFRQITGDNNPLHCDEDYARSRGYGGRVVYGMLTASYLSTLAGMYLPGEHSLIHEVDVKFTAPNGEIGKGAITISGRVTEKHDLFKRLTLKVTITADDGTKLLRGTMRAGVAE
jgi:acyl dehydratase